MAEGDPKDLSQEFREQMDKYFNMDREMNKRYELPSLYKLNHGIETGKLPEEKELVTDYRKAGIELIDPLVKLQIDARTRFNYNDYSVIRLSEMMDRYTQDFQQAVQRVDTFDELGGPEVSGLAKVMNADLVRIDAFHRLESHTIGFKFFYYDAKGAFSLLATGRRHGAINTGDWISMFSPLEDLRLTDQEREGLKVPETIYVGEEISKMTAQLDHFERAVGAMNRYNPFKPDGQEMPFQVSETEQELLASVFNIEVNTNLKPGETDEKRDKRLDQTRPDYSPEHTTKIQVNGKEFYTNLLSFYVTADPEQDRRRYEATIKALVEVDALNILKTLPRVFDHVTGENRVKFDGLLKQVEEVRDRILNNWNSMVKPFRARLADAAYEQNFNIQTGTQNVAELAYRFTWGQKDGNWDFKVEIPGPENAQDAVNARNPLVHELTYKVIKGRGVSDIMPWPDHEKVNQMLKVALMESRGDDPKPIILADPRLAIGAATIGLYPGEAERVLSGKELEQVRRSRVGLEFNRDALRILDSMLWIYDLSAEGCYLPMPIKPMYDSFNLYKVMKDSVTGKTVFEMLQEEGKTLRDIDFKNITWYAGDAWEVNMKMIEDVIQMMYGRQDPKYVESFLGDKTGGLGEMIKKMDIGTRAEKWEIDVRKNLDPNSPDYNVYERIQVPKGFLEIMQIAYLTITHTALVKNKIWDKGGWKEHVQTTYWEDIQDWITVAMYEPEKKGDFENYRGTMVLMMVAIGEWYAAAARKYNDDATGLKDRVDIITPDKEGYTEPKTKNF